MENSKWVEAYSNTYKKKYWYNTESGTSSWSPPEDFEDGSNSQKRRKTVAEQEEPAEDVQIAIIVPFRDLHAEQNRLRHLREFFPAISKFLAPSGKGFRIYVIEQSSDNRRFNRGKLLNIGFKLALHDGCKIFVFHDVDLLPSSELLSSYVKVPSKPIHIARVWNRYSNNEKYFGGIVSFSAEMFTSINGYPNNFWGWGGEDDELFNRLRELGLSYEAPPEGTITDLEAMDLQQKLQFLRQHRDWKCMNKTEVLAEHAATWRRNGLADLSFHELNREWLSPECVKITVDVGLNDHWTDSVCHINDDQLQSVESLKRSRSCESSEKIGN